MSRVQMGCESHIIRRRENGHFQGEQWVTISGQCDPNNTRVVNTLFSELVRALPPHLVIATKKKLDEGSYSLEFHLITDTKEQFRQANTAKKTLETILGNKGYTVNGISPDMLILLSSRA